MTETNKPMSAEGIGMAGTSDEFHINAAIARAQLSQAQPVNRNLDHLQHAPKMVGDAELVEALEWCLGDSEIVADGKFAMASGGELKIYDFSDDAKKNVERARSAIAKHRNTQPQVVAEKHPGTHTCSECGKIIFCTPEVVMNDYRCAQCSSGSVPQVLSQGVPEGMVLVPIKEIKAMADCLTHRANGVYDTVWLYPDTGIGITLHDCLTSYLEDAAPPSEGGNTNG